MHRKGYAGSKKLVIDDVVLDINKEGKRKAHWVQFDLGTELITAQPDWMATSRVEVVLCFLSASAERSQCSTKFATSFKQAYRALLIGASRLLTPRSASMATATRTCPLRGRPHLRRGAFFLI